MQLSETYKLVREGKDFPKEEEVQEEPFKTLRDVYEDVNIIARGDIGDEKFDFSGVTNNKRYVQYIQRLVAPELDKITTILRAERGWGVIGDNNIDSFILLYLLPVFNNNAGNILNVLNQSTNVDFPINDLLKNTNTPLTEIFKPPQDINFHDLIQLEMPNVHVKQKFNTGGFEVMFTLLTNAQKSHSEGDITFGSSKMEIKGFLSRSRASGARIIINDLNYILNKKKIMLKALFNVFKNSGINYMFIGIKDSVDEYVTLNIEELSGKEERNILIELKNKNVMFFKNPKETYIRVTLTAPGLQSNKNAVYNEYANLVKTCEKGIQTIINNQHVLDTTLIGQLSKLKNIIKNSNNTSKDIDIIQLQINNIIRDHPRKGNELRWIKDIPDKLKLYNLQQ